MHLKVDFFYGTIACLLLSDEFLRDVNQQQQNVMIQLEGLHHQAPALHINLVQGLHTTRVHPPPFQAPDPLLTSLLVGTTSLVVLKAALLSHG